MSEQRGGMDMVGKECHYCGSAADPGYSRVNFYICKDCHERSVANPIAFSGSQEFGWRDIGEWASLSVMNGKMPSRRGQYWRRMKEIR